MNEQYEAVRKFHKAFGQPAPDMPTILDSGDKGYRIDFRSNELENTLLTMREDIASSLGGRVMLRSAFILEELIEFMRAETIEDQADALIDIIYFALGTFVEIGVKPETLFDIVQAANMAKLDENGQPIMRDGKIQKPEGWERPEPKLIEEIRLQMEGWQAGKKKQHLRDLLLTGALGHLLLDVFGVDADEVMGEARALRLSEYSETLEGSAELEKALKDEAKAFFLELVDKVTS